jgi:transcription initiation factor TFIIIB Brf1 subunit/transcription initiation factor TFIIB
MVGGNCNDARDKIKIYSEKLGLSQDAMDTGYKFLDQFQKKNQEFNPEEIAAGAVYFSAIMVGERKTQEAVGNAANINTNKVGKGYKQVRESVDVDIML